MDSLEILEYARKLTSAHGDAAEAQAAQKAVTFEQAGDKEQAQLWRRIRAAIAQAKSPHQG